MKKNKYTEFYFENDKNYPASVYWDLYDVDRYAAIAKYKGRMYCPECHQAPIIAVQTKKTRYLKVTGVEKHSTKCSYYKELEKKTIIEGYATALDNSDIKNSLLSCIDKLVDIGEILHEKIGGKGLHKTGVYSAYIGEERKKNKYVSQKNFNHGNLEKSLNSPKTFYGKCVLFLKEYSSKNGEKGYYLKAYTINMKRQIFDIYISKKVREYLGDRLKDIPMSLSQGGKYYLSVWGIMRKQDKYFNLVLQHSDYIMLRKVETDN